MSLTNMGSSTALVAPASTGLLRLFALMAVLLVASPIARGITLGDALDAPELTWTTSGPYGGWSAQTSTTHDGIAAGDSGPIYSSGTASTLQTTVNGPGTLTFWWMNSSMDTKLSFSVGTTEVTNIMQYSSWQQQTFYLGSGSQALKWVYSNLYSPTDIYHGYLDQVSYTSGATAPLILSQPTGQSQVSGLNASFTVSAGGTPPLSYQWAFTGTNIPGATTSVYTVTNVEADKLGYYSVVVTNESGSIVSSNAALEIGPITAWGYGPTWAPTGATNVLAMAAGAAGNLLLSADGTVSGWGKNTNGQAAPADLTNAVAIAMYSQGLALKADGTVAAWGGQYLGETNVPPGLSNVVAIVAGRSAHSLALKCDGTVAAWGGNRGETNIPAGLTNVVAVAGGIGFDLALKADGTVTAWGNYSPGVPVGLTNAVAIAAGAWHALALLGNGMVVAWGDNTIGQAAVPTELTNAVAIAAGDFHSVALLANGTVAAWGRPGLGQTSVPTGLTNVIAISAGSLHVLARVGCGQPVVRAPETEPTLSASGFSLLVPSESGRVYALEYKDSLSDANWIPLPLVAGTGANLLLLDATAADSQRFYRVRRW
jgi:hypothetical protein